MVKVEKMVRENNPADARQGKITGMAGRNLIQKSLLGNKNEKGIIRVRAAEKKSLWVLLPQALKGYGNCYRLTVNLMVSLSPATPFTYGVAFKV